MTRVRNEAIINSETGQASDSEEKKIRDIFIYSSIEHNNFCGVMSANKLLESLKDSQGISQIVLHINSEGGDMFEGIAIYNLLRSSGVEITAVIEGECSSSASIIAMSASKIIMKRGSIIMIHKPFSYAFGDDEHFSKIAETLKIMNESIIDIYQARTGLARETINDLMSKETYMSGEMAKNLGFCDEYENAEPEENAPKNAPKTEDEPEENESEHEDESKQAPLTGSDLRRFINFLPVKNRVRDNQERVINLMAGYINGKRNH